MQFIYYTACKVREGTRGLSWRNCNPEGFAGIGALEDCLGGAAALPRRMADPYGSPVAAGITRKEQRRRQDQQRDRSQRKQLSGSAKRKRALLASELSAPSAAVETSVNPTAVQTAVQTAIPIAVLTNMPPAVPAAAPAAVLTVMPAAPTAVQPAANSIGIVGCIEDDGQSRRRLAPPWMVCKCGMANRYICSRYNGSCPDPQTSDESDSASDAAVPAAVSTAVQWSEDTDAHEDMSRGSDYEHDGWGSDYEDDGSAAGDEALNAVMAAYHRALDAAELVQYGGVGGGHKAVDTSADNAHSACVWSESEADGDGCSDWHPKWLEISVSDYEIAKFRTVVE